MKKFFLVFVLLFSFSTLFAARNMTFQDARNYCNDLGGRLPTIGELASICDPNKRDRVKSVVDKYNNEVLERLYEASKDLEIESTRLNSSHILISRMPSSA